MLDKIFPSKTSREFYKKKNYEFNDVEKATLIWNSRMISWDDRLKYLKQIADKTKDIELKKILYKHIDIENRTFEFIKTRKSNEYLYFIKVLGESDGIDIQAYFDSWDKALNFAKDCFYEANTRFSINVAPKNLDDTSSEIGKVLHNYEKENSDDSDDDIDRFLNKADWASGVYFWGSKIVNVWSISEVLQTGSINENDLDFDTYEYLEAFINAPIPYKSGDIVKNIFTGEVGVIDNASYTDEDGMPRGQDYYDWQHSFYTIDKYGRWGHEHYSPQILELTTVKVRKGHKEDKLKKDAIMALSKYFQNDENDDELKNKCLFTAQKYAEHFTDGIYQHALSSNTFDQMIF